MGGRPKHYGTLTKWVDDHLSHRGKKCLIWPFNRSTHGYGMMRFNGKMVLVSRVICEKVQGPPPTALHEAAHSCGNGHGGCVHPRHLRWKTPKQNQAERVKHGTSLRGSQITTSKLTEPDVVRIVARLDAKETQQSIADDFGVTLALISCIKLGKAWGWLTGRSANA